MGTLPIVENEPLDPSPRYSKATISITTTTAEYADPETGDATIEIVVDGTKFELTAPLKAIDETFVQRFSRAFATNEAFAARVAATWILNFPVPATSNPNLERQISHLQKLGDGAKFKDYAALKSGRDALSSLGYEALRQRLDSADISTIASHFENGTDRASAIRWCLRGLTVDQAIRKTKTDLEISQNAGRRP